MLRSSSTSSMWVRFSTRCSSCVSFDDLVNDEYYFLWYSHAYETWQLQTNVSLWRRGTQWRKFHNIIRCVSSTIMYKILTMCFLCDVVVVEIVHFVHKKSGLRVRLEKCIIENSKLPTSSSAIYDRVSLGLPNDCVRAVNDPFFICY